VQNDVVDWEAFVERIRRGDSDAVAEVFEIYRGYLHRYLERLLDPRLGTRVGMSDVMQDVYVDVQRQIQSFLREPRVPLFVWLRGVAMQRAIKTNRDHIQTARRSLNREHRLNLASSTTWGHGLVANDTSPSEQIARQELQSQIRRALELLAPADRDLIVARQFEGRCNRDVASSLGITESAASMRYARALSRLQDLIEQSSCANEMQR
jgi:RNA polymerase sigma-70 factor (ECF subfamily)